MAIIFTPIISDTIELTGTPFLYNCNVLPFYKDLHLINLSVSNLNDLADITLYKYYSYQTLSYLLKGSRLYMDRVQESWEDCYENFFLKCQFMLDGLQIGADTMIPGVFGQSWTTERESDAMWRIYSRDKNGVRVKTNALKLFKSVYIDDECMANTWFGMVRYDTMPNFIAEIQNQIQTQQSYEVFQYTFPKTEFMKRKEFEHEKEFRVVVMLDSEQSSKLATFKRLAYRIDLDSFIDELCLDPRLDTNQFEGLKDKLIKDGADPHKIVQSKLYEFTPTTFNLK